MDGFLPRAQGGSILTGVCKNCPSKRSITIAAFVSSSGEGHSDVLSIAVINNDQNEVLASYQDALVNSSAPRIDLSEDKLRLDTAFYNIAPNVVAFGLDVIHKGKTRYGYGGRDLRTVRTLYIIDREIIRSIAYDGLPISYRKKIEGRFSEDVMLSISVAKNTSDGFANLWIYATAKRSDGKKFLRKPLRFELKYERNMYGDRDIGSYSTPYLDGALDEWEKE